MERKQHSTILFNACSEFLVCKREEENGILKIYIRQIETGLKSGRYLFWLDDGLNNKIYRYRDAIKQVQSEMLIKNARYVFKAQSLMARSYFDSEIFKHATLDK